MASQMNNPLDQLKPIIPPDHGVGMWPLAPGWWFLVILCLATFVAFIFLRPLLKKRKHLKAIQANTLQLLNQYYTECAAKTDTPAALQYYLQKSNDIFKRVVHSQPHLAAYSNLTGKSWIDFMLTIDPETKFATFYGDNLYALRSNEKINLADLHKWACQWITKASKKTKGIYNK